MVGNTWQNYARFGGIGVYGQDYDKTNIKSVFLAGNNNVLNHNTGLICISVIFWTIKLSVTE
jgi:hypothetical protein